MDFHDILLIILLIITLVFTLLPFLEENLGFTGHFDPILGATKRRKIETSPSIISKKELESRLSDHEFKSDAEYNELKEKILKKYGVTEDELPEDYHEDPRDPEYNDLEDDAEMFYTTLLRNRAAEMKMKLYQCIPKFVCEAHSQGEEKATTPIEKEWLKLYRLRDVTNNRHEFQTAAHMGMLFKGLQPSPCYQMYTECPITMMQFKKFLDTYSV